MPELYPPLPLVGGPQNRFAIRIIDDMNLQDSKEPKSVDLRPNQNCSVLQRFSHWPYFRKSIRIPHNDRLNIAKANMNKAARANRWFFNGILKRPRRMGSR